MTAFSAASHLVHSDSIHHATLLLTGHHGRVSVQSLLLVANTLIAAG